MKRCRSTSRASALALALVAGSAGAASADDSVPFSSSAASLSNTTLAATVIAPIGLQLAGDPKDLVMYGEVLGANVALNLVAKYTFHRPRPYTRIHDPRVERYVASTSDAKLSFYSGHASLAFAAAVSGSLLYDSTDTRQRAAVWGVELALAATTANLRVRAGKHYASDVITGAVIGSAIGIAIPALQGNVTAPTPSEWAAIGGGLLVGVVGSQLIPLRRDILEPLEGVAPVAYKGGGGGLSFSGAF